ncbi:sialic acid-binding Ig-like lectin 5 isoform X2 [Macrotis lagotis]|uniref:sialic acid-binding Ig-like lectin 5 isoform X2 n=1 Tax=Macrotis lagotis TaxID=92651 RepID=UPI003D69C626
MLGLEEVPGWSLDSSSNLISSGMLVCLLLLPVIWGRLPQEEATFSVNIPETVMSQENLCVQIPCSFYYLGKGNINNQIFLNWYWNESLVASSKQGIPISERFKDRFKIMGNVQNHNCSLYIQNAQKSDTGNYTLSLKKRQSKSISEKKVFVNISDLTQKPDIQAPETLKTGVQGTLICKMPGACDGENSPIFLWKGSALSFPNASSKVSFTPRPKDHGTNITCTVTFKNSSMTSEKTVQLNVTFSRSLGNESYLPVLEGESLNLSCAVDSNPAVPLNWMKGKQIQTSSQISAAGVVSLRLHQIGPSDSGEYTCQIQGPQKSKKASLMLSVQYPPKLFNSSCSWTREGLLCTCSVRAEPAPTLCWWLGESPLQDNSSKDTLQVVSSTSGVWTNSSLSLKQKLDPALNLRCEGKNPHGAHSLSILLIPDRTTPCAEMNIKTLIIGIFCGTAVTGLLALGLLFFAVKTLKRKSEENLGEMLRLKRSPSTLLHGTACSTSEEGLELHYASLTFKGLGPRDPQESVYTSTEYAEIKFPK